MASAETVQNLFDALAKANAESGPDNALPQAITEIVPSPLEVSERLLGTDFTNAAAAVLGTIWQNAQQQYSNPASPQLAPVSLDGHLEKAREVIQRIQVDVDSKVEVKGHIDGATITSAQGNTVKRRVGGSNMPLRSRAGRTGE